MSKEHMLYLKAALEKAGWVILLEGGQKSDDLFTLHEEMVVWDIINPSKECKEKLSFYAFDKLGRRTESLKDILYCSSVNKSNRLYFPKHRTAD